MPEGYKLTVYRDFRFSGDSGSFSGDVATLGAKIDRAISSLVIE